MNATPTSLHNSFSNNRFLPNTHHSNKLSQNACLQKNMTYQHTRHTRKIIFQHSTLIIHCALHTQTSTQRIQKSYSTLTTIRNSYRQLPFSLRFFINYILKQRTLSLQVSISLTSALSSAYLKTDISSLLYRHRRSPPLSHPPYSRIALPVYRR